MKRLILAGFALAACSPSQPAERYGFLTRLGNDTISIENVVRRGNTLTSDAVDRFPRVRQRHTEITLAPDGGIRHVTMHVITPSEPANQRERHIVADVTRDSVIMTKRDATGGTRWAFAHGPEPVVAHVPQMYSLYEIYFAAALAKPSASTTPAGDTIRLRQFYIDREFDRFPLAHATVRRLPGNKAEVWHDWLAGVGEATLDSSHRLLSYSGARTTYKVDVTRISDSANVQAIGAQFAALESKKGTVAQLSVRDTARATVGGATFAIDYGRPLARGRKLLGDVVPYDYVWRTGANAATQFTTSAPITLGGIAMPAGTYSLWTVPRTTGADLIVNKQNGQWGTDYDGSRDLGMAHMHTETTSTPVEAFTISIAPVDDRHGTLVMEWGPFRWTAPIGVESGQKRIAGKS